MRHADSNVKILHASCVALGNTAVLILGPSRSGKSALALQLMALGAVLIADDRTILSAGEYGITVSCPKSIAGQIEARGVGILKVDFQDWGMLHLVVDLDEPEHDRLPQSRDIVLLNHKIPLLRTPDGPHFPAAIIQMLKGGRIA